MLAFGQPKECWIHRKIIKTNDGEYDKKASMRTRKRHCIYCCNEILINYQPHDNEHELNEDWETHENCSCRTIDIPPQGTWYQTYFGSTLRKKLNLLNLAGNKNICFTSDGHFQKYDDIERVILFFEKKLASLLRWVETENEYFVHPESSDFRDESKQKRHKDRIPEEDGNDYCNIKDQDESEVLLKPARTDDDDDDDDDPNEDKRSDRQKILDHHNIQQGEHEDIIRDIIAIECIFMIANESFREGNPWVVTYPVWKNDNVRFIAWPRSMCPVHINFKPHHEKNAELERDGKKHMYMLRRLDENKSGCKCAFIDQRQAAAAAVAQQHPQQAQQHQAQQHQAQQHPQQAQQQQHQAQHQQHQQQHQQHQQQQHQAQQQQQQHQQHQQHQAQQHQQHQQQQQQHQQQHQQQQHQQQQHQQQQHQQQAQQHQQHQAQQQQHQQNQAQQNQAQQHQHQAQQGYVADQVEQIAGGLNDLGVIPNRPQQQAQQQQRAPRSQQQQRAPRSQQQQRAPRSQQQQEVMQRRIEDENRIEIFKQTIDSSMRRLQSQTQMEINSMIVLAHMHRPPPAHVVTRAYPQFFEISSIALRHLETRRIDAYDVYNENISWTVNDAKVSTHDSVDYGRLVRMKEIMDISSKELFVMKITCCLLVKKISNNKTYYEVYTLRQNKTQNDARYKYISEEENALMEETSHIRNTVYKNAYDVLKDAKDTNTSRILEQLFEFVVGKIKEMSLVDIACFSPLTSWCMNEHDLNMANDTGHIKALLLEPHHLHQVVYGDTQDQEVFQKVIKWLSIMVTAAQFHQVHQGGIKQLINKYMHKNPNEITEREHVYTNQNEFNDHKQLVLILFQQLYDTIRYDLPFAENIGDINGHFNSMYSLLVQAPQFGNAWRI